MKAMKSIRLLAVLLTSLLLGACVTTTPRGTSLDEVVKMTDEERALVSAERQERREAKSWMDTENEKDLWGGLPSTFEVEGIRLVKVWDRDSRKLSFYDTQNTGVFGSDSLLLMAVLTEPNKPVPQVSVNKVTGKQEFTVLVGNVSVQDTMGRLVVKSMFGLATASVNGVFAAKAGSCDNCGAITNVVAPTALSTSQSQNANSMNLNAALGRCEGECL